MFKLSVGILDDEETIDIVNYRLKNLHNYGFDIEMENKKATGNTFFYLQLDDNEDTRTNIVDALSYCVEDIMKNKYIGKFIQKNYFYFDNNEKEKLILNTRGILDGDELSNDGRLALLNKRMTRIKSRINEYVNKNSKILLDGFIRFRLKDIIEEIEDAVEKAVDDYLIEKEYNEFIKLLRYFVEIQEPKMEEVHVVCCNNSTYMLLDSNMKTINNELLEDLAKEIAYNDVTCDDILVSSLITIAPNRIKIHNNNTTKNKEVINTIKNVFYGKVDVYKYDDTKIFDQLLIKKK